jgi:hypothetical protein
VELAAKIRPKNDLDMLEMIDFGIDRGTNEPSQVRDNFFIGVDVRGRNVQFALILRARRPLWYSTLFPPFQFHGDRSGKRMAQFPA